MVPLTLVVEDVIALDVMEKATLVAGHAGRKRKVRWVHTWPEVMTSFSGGELLLTTGYSWPDMPSQQRRIVRELHNSGIAALVFQTGRYFPDIPDAVVAEADELDLPVISVPPDLSFIDLTEAINREIIRRQYHVLEGAEHIHRALSKSALEAQSLESIAGVLASLLEKPVVIHDVDFRLLAAVDVPTGACETLTALLAEGANTLSDRLRHLTGARPLLAIGLKKSRRAPCFNPIVAPIRAGSDLLGFLWIVQSDESVSELDLRAAESGAIIVGLHLLRQRAVADAESRVRHTFVDAALRGELDESVGMRERAHMLGFDTEGTYQVAIIAPLAHRDDGKALRHDQLLPGERLNRSLRNALSDLHIEPFTSHVLHRAVCIVAVTPDDPKARRSLFRRIWERLKRYEPDMQFIMAVGRVSDGIGGLPASLDEAERTLSIAGGPGVFWYEDCVVDRILLSVNDKRALKDLYEKTIGRLRAARRGEDLVDTIRMLVANGFHQREAARALGIHWNTMGNRIQRLEELLGGSLTDPQLRFEIMLALEIERIQSTLSPPQR